MKKANLLAVLILASSLQSQAQATIKENISETVEVKKAQNNEIRFANYKKYGFKTVDGITGLSVTLKDKSLQIVSVQLKGPNQYVADMPWAKSAQENQYILKYPRTFTALIEGETYSLTAIVSGANGSEFIKTKEFKCSRPQIELFENQK